MSKIIIHQFNTMREHIAYSRKVWETQKSYVKEHWNGETAIKDGCQIGRDFPGGFKECFEVAPQPWKEGMEALKLCEEALKGVELPIPESIRRRKVWKDDTGDSVDIHRLYAGVPYWRDIAGRQAQGGCPIITVVANIGSPYYYTPEQIMWRGIAGILISDILEDAGYRVEFWAARQGNSQYGTGEKLLTYTLLKESHGPLVKSLIVSGLSGWYYRTIVWLSYYHLDPDMEPSYGLGSPCEPINDECIEIITGSDYQGKVFQINDVFDKDACVKLVQQTLEEFNPSEAVAVY